MNFSSMLCLALANAEGFMSSWKAQDQEVPATNDLMEIEDLTLTAPSPLQRLLSDEDDEEQEEEEKDDEEQEEEDEEDGEGGQRIDKSWSTPQVAGGALGVLVLGALGGAVVFKNFWKSSPEERLAIVAIALDDTQKAALDSDANVECVKGTHIISTYKSLDAFKAKHGTINYTDVSGKEGG